jgi:hypothetical protein
VFHLLAGHPGGEQSLFRVVLVALQVVIGLLPAQVLVRQTTDRAGPGRWATATAGG